MLTKCSPASETFPLISLMSKVLRFFNFVMWSIPSLYPYQTCQIIIERVLSGIHKLLKVILNSHGQALCVLLGHPKHIHRAGRRIDSQATCLFRHCSRCENDEPYVCYEFISHGTCDHSDYVSFSYKIVKKKYSALLYEWK